MSSIIHVHMYVYEQIESIHATLAAPVSIRACLPLPPADAHANKQISAPPIHIYLLDRSTGRSEIKKRHRWVGVRTGGKSEER